MPTSELLTPMYHLKTFNSVMPTWTLCSCVFFPIGILTYLILMWCALCLAVSPSLDPGTTRYSFLRVSCPAKIKLQPKRQVHYQLYYSFTYGLEVIYYTALKQINTSTTNSGLTKEYEYPW